MRINIFENLVTSVREINRKYAKPRIEMTLFVKICLFSLRVYLIALIGIMIFKFITMVK